MIINNNNFKILNESALWNNFIYKFIKTNAPFIEYFKNKYWINCLVLSNSSTIEYINDLK